MKGAEANSPSPVSLSLQNGSSLQIVSDPDRNGYHLTCETDAAKSVSKRPNFRPHFSMVLPSVTSMGQRLDMSVPKSSTFGEVLRKMCAYSLTRCLTGAAERQNLYCLVGVVNLGSRSPHHLSP